MGRTKTYHPRPSSYEFETVLAVFEQGGDFYSILLQLPLPAGHTHTQAWPLCPPGSLQSGCDSSGNGQARDVPDEE